MISKKAKKIILDKRNCWDKDGYAISKSKAIEAVEIAEQEIKGNAIGAFEEFVGRYCRDNNIHYICDDAEHYIKAFKKLINK
jgi:hypothetical protein